MPHKLNRQQLLLRRPRHLPHRLLTQVVAAIPAVRVFNPVDGGAGSDGCSPIIIDLTGDGFVLTDAQHGVMFDIPVLGTAPDLMDGKFK